MGWSGGVPKGSCAAFGEEGRGLEEEPRKPMASSWNSEGCKYRLLGEVLTLEAVFVLRVHSVRQWDPSNHQILPHTVKVTVSN